MRRFPFAFLLVGVLGLLAAGGAVLGAFQAPAGADLAVHNGAAQTLSAERVVGKYTNSQYNGLVISFDFSAPDRVRETATGADGQVQGQRTLGGAQATGILGPVKSLLELGGFSTSGRYFDRTSPASVLFPKATRAKITGTYETLVQVETGFVVSVLLRVDAKEGTHHLVQTFDYRLSRVDAWTRSA